MDGENPIHKTACIHGWSADNTTQSRMFQLPLSLRDLNPKTSASRATCCCCKPMPGGAKIKWDYRRKNMEYGIIKTDEQKVLCSAATSHIDEGPVQTTYSSRYGLL